MTAKNEKLTQEDLKSVIRYHSDTGIFIWDKDLGVRAKSGNVAGTYGGSKYRQIRIKGVIYQAHRLAWLYMAGEWPKGQIDHINHIRDDNRWVNLRVVSSSTNAKNRSMQSDNKSGVTGVSWHNSSKTWEARIIFNGKRIYLGRHKEKSKAVSVRGMANVLYNFHENHGV